MSRLTFDFLMSLSVKMQINLLGHLPAAKGKPEVIAKPVFRTIEVLRWLLKFRPLRLSLKRNY